MTTEITRDEIKLAIAKGNVTLIEALPEKYYNAGHLPGALQINYDEIENKAGKLLPDKSALIITYCASDTCPNSTYAAEHLSAMGYINVKKYAGGKKDWTEAGEQLETL